jgi:hypothetical protein
MPGTRVDRVGAAAVGVVGFVARADTIERLPAGVLTVL